MPAVEKLSAFLQWLNENEVQWEKDKIEIREKGDSFGVYALKNISKKDEAIVKIPKESILSAKTAGISNVLSDEQIEGDCSLVIAVLYELSNGPNSPWFGYLQTLPQAEENVPVFWNDSERELLKGTELEHSIQQDTQDLKNDYQEIVEPLMEKYPYIFTPEHYTFEAFQKVSTLVSSCSFAVDRYHERAMVPFADIFNHQSGIDHVNFTAQFDVCDACGATEYCGHLYLDDSEGNQSDRESEDADQDIDLEAESSEEERNDENDDSEDAQEEEETELPDLEKLESEGVDFWDSENDDDDTKDICDMILNRPVLKGEEIFLSYGDLPNTVLLSKYGFCYDDNKNDYVSISEDDIVDVCLALTKDSIQKAQKDLDEETLEKLAVEQTQPRWEFFVNYEQLICGSKHDGQDNSEPEDETHDHCCGGDHDHEHASSDTENDGSELEHEPGHDRERATSHDLEHEHGDSEHENGGSDEENNDNDRSKPYFINSEGLFEDSVMCLLYLLFIDDHLFHTFTEDVHNAVAFFEQLDESSGKRPLTDDLFAVKTKIYGACRALAEQRRSRYLDDDGNCKSIEEEIIDKSMTKDLRHKYALTCRIGEKRLIERSIAHYDSMIKQFSSSESLQPKRKKGRL